MQVIGDITPRQTKARIGDEVLDIARRAGAEVVQAEDLITLQQQSLAKMRTEKTCSTCNDGSRHTSPLSDFCLTESSPASRGADRGVHSPASAHDYCVHAFAYGQQLGQN